MQIYNFSLLMLNYYEILEVSQYASQTEIKAAFKKMAVRYHPDKNPDDKAAEDKFKLVNEAYQVLGNEYKKSVYDQRLFYKDEGKSYQGSTGTNGGTQKRYYTSYRRRTYKGYNPYNPQLHLLALGGFVLSLVFVWLIYTLIENHYSDKNYKLAFDLYKNKQYQAAFDKVHEAILQNDTNVQAYYLRGLLLANHFNEPKNALYCFNRCIIYGRDAATPERNNYTLGELPDFYLQRAKCFYRTASYAQAIKDFEEVLKIRKDDEKNEEEILATVGDIYLFKQNNLSLANKYYQKILDKKPTHTAALLGRAVVHFNLRNYKFCIGELERLAVTETQNSNLYYFLGSSYLIYKKDTTTACQNLKQAANLGKSEAEILLKKCCKN